MQARRIGGGGAPPPPEEYTEKQTDFDYDLGLYADSYTRLGQRLNISNRRVTKLGFWLSKQNEPTGDVTLTIRKVSDDSLIISKVWGDAADLTTEPTYYEVEFATPTLINEEVRISVEFLGGTATHAVVVHLQLSDVKADEYLTFFKTPDWTDNEANDTAYKYKYYEV